MTDGGVPDLWGSFGPRNRIDDDLMDTDLVTDRILYKNNLVTYL